MAAKDVPRKRRHAKSPGDGDERSANGLNERGDWPPEVELKRLAWEASLALFFCC